MLTEEEAGDLLSVAPGLQQFRDALFRLTGRHPYLLHYLAEKMYEAGPEASLRAVELQSRRHLGDLFSRWKETLGAKRCAVYQALTAVPAGQFETEEDLRQRASVDELSEPLRVWAFHGLIEDPDRPAVGGSLFRDWFRQNASVGAAAPQPDLAGPIQAIHARMLADATVHGKGRALEELVAAIFGGGDFGVRGVQTERDY